MSLILLYARSLEGRNDFKLNFSILVPDNAFFLSLKNFTMPKVIFPDSNQWLGDVRQMTRVINIMMGNKKVSQFTDTNFYLCRDIEKNDFI